MSKPGSIFGGVLLVAGTCIGGGMLALPVMTSLGGFIPSLVIYLLCWIFMTCTGLLLLEVYHWMDGESNLVTMARKTLGPVGAYTAWGIYLILFYCLTLAYVVGCGNLLSNWFTLPDWLGPLLFVAIFAPFVVAGAKVVGRINSILMIGLAASFAAFVWLGYSHVNTAMFEYRNWDEAWFALPVTFTAFGFQGIIPTLSSYMHNDDKKTRLVIIIGGFLSFLTYVIWEWLILGIIPTHGPGGLAEALDQGQNAVEPLKNYLKNPMILNLGAAFAFFALVTSFLGVCLAFVDFLADGLKVKKDFKGRLWLSAIVILPPTVLGVIYPYLFLIALDYAGGFGCAILLGLLPILMVWAGRYRLGLSNRHAVPGGRFLLLILLAFVLCEIGYEIATKL